MLIIPAIDLINGKCVRLTEGDFNKKKEYSDDPISIAHFFKEAGAKRIHIIDLDGAETGTSKNRNIIKKIKNETGLNIETGGGIRKEEDVQDLIDGGIDYLILGTIIVENFPIVNKWLKKFGDKFIAGIDAKNKIVQTRGWKEDGGLDAIEFGKILKNSGITTSIFTDISKDGKLQGPNIKHTKEFSIQTGLNVILSGGITNESDIINACQHEKDGIFGIIIGKAFYEGKIDLPNIISKYQKY